MISIVIYKSFDLSPHSRTLCDGHKVCTDTEIHKL